MTPEIFFRYLHFVGIITAVSAVVSEHLLLKKELTRAEIGRLSRVDAVYGIAALTVVAAGLTLWLSDIGKPSVYYSKNSVFHAKVTCFVIVALLSIYPTVFFIKNRKGDPQQKLAVPKAVFWVLRIELLLFFLIPLLATLMARGVGFFG